MDRREFLKKAGTYSAAAAAGVLFGFGPSRRLFADTTGTSLPDLAAVMGGSPAEMFDAGIAALGGMRAFVKKGQTVAIKPNISWSAPVERGATTNPQLVQRITEHCFDAGALKVYVLDNTINSWESCYKATGVEAAVKLAGGQMAPAHAKGYYQQVSVPGAKVLKTVMVHELVLEADVIINVPILKHHGSTRMTSALKNLMGLIWDRRFYHSAGLSSCIAEFPLVRKPHLNVIDAYTVMTAGGPQGSSYRSSLELKKMQIISPDMVAADAAASRIMGHEPDDIRHITMAADLRIGRKDIENLNIKRISL